ncbi:unnamed protein product, partial [Scytosiphon promiscuus]
AVGSLLDREEIPKRGEALASGSCPQVRLGALDGWLVGWLWSIHLLLLTRNGSEEGLRRLLLHLVICERGPAYPAIAAAAARHDVHALEYNVLAREYGTLFDGCGGTGVEAKYARDVFFNEV